MTRIKKIFIALSNQIISNRIKDVRTVLLSVNYDDSDFLECFYSRGLVK